jgi:hypothetical protein
MTVNSLWPTNSAMLDWLASDTYFKTQPHKPGLHGQLAQGLTQLEAHLQLWKAKYLAWIPDHPEHGLVYMADEGMHGLSFPGAIDGLVDRVVKETS